MDHCANDARPPIIIEAATPQIGIYLSLICDAKGRDWEYAPNMRTPYTLDDVKIRDTKLSLWGLDVIVEYLNERYPHPPLLATDPIARAAQRSVLRKTYDRSLNPRMDTARELLQHAANIPRFISGEQLTFLDLWTASISPRNNAFSDRVYEEILR